MDCFIGIDVSTARLDIASLPDRESWTVTNDDAGLAGLTARLVAPAPARIVMEATDGFEPLAALTLLATLPELGQLSLHQIAALVGVAPMNRDSGTRRRKRMVWGNRAPVRAVLYMATLVGLQHNPVLRVCYARLRAAGKPFEVAATACIRKLLTILNAMLHQNCRWDPQHG